MVSKKIELSKEVNFCTLDENDEITCLITDKPFMILGVEAFICEEKKCKKNIEKQYYIVNHKEIFCIECVGKMIKKGGCGIITLLKIGAHNKILGFFSEDPEKCLFCKMPPPDVDIQMNRATICLNCKGDFYNEFAFFCEKCGKKYKSISGAERCKKACERKERIEQEGKKKINVFKNKLISKFSKENSEVCEEEEKREESIEEEKKRESMEEEEKKGESTEEEDVNGVDIEEAYIEEAITKLNLSSN